MVMQILKRNIFRGFAFLALFVAIAAGCAMGSKHYSASHHRISGKVGNEVVQILSKPQQVSVALVALDGKRKLVQSGESKILTKDSVVELQKMLLDDTHYIFDRTKKCLFIPEIAFTFKNKREVIVVVSTLCNQIRIIDGENKVVFDYDPMSDQFNQFSHDMMTKLNNT